jgi:xanthine dehydrogenase iron-sulfur cluster and FAD-binding subunit A
MRITSRSPAGSSRQSSHVFTLFNGNICRCGAYVQILEAIQDVVEARQGNPSGLPWPPQGGHTSPDAAQAD